MQHPPKKLHKRKGKKLLICLTGLALVLSAAFVLLLPAILSAFPAQKLDYEVMQSTIRTLARRDASRLESVTIWHDGQNSYTLRMQDGALMLESGDALKPIAADHEKAILEAVTQIIVQDTVAEDAADVAGHLADMGFDGTHCRAVARYQDGSEETIEVGNIVPHGTDYYFRWSGAPGVYLCHSGMLESLTMEERILLPVEQPVIYGSLADSLRLKNRSGECAFSFANGLSGQLTAPHVYPLTDDAAQTLMTALSQFRLGTYEAPLTEENRAAYGLEDPLCVVEFSQRAGVTTGVDDEGALTAVPISAQNFRFVIGRAEGEFFYTCEYQGQVYLISRFLAETLVQADWKSLISRTPAAMGNELLTDILLETPDASAHVQISRTESVLANNELELDSEGNIVYQTSVTLNGQPAPAELLETLQDRLDRFTVEGEIPANAQIAEAPRWRLTLTAESGKVRVVEGYRLDVFSDAVAVDGVMCHYVYDEAIDVLMTGLV